MESTDGARQTGRTDQSPSTAGGPEAQGSLEPADHGAGAPFAGQRLSRADVERLVSAATSPALDLRDVDLRQVDLTNLDLTGARLDGARLDGARLDGARLERCRLCGTHLRGAQLVGAHLAHADLTRAVLEEANLEECDLRGATLIDARLAHAHMSRAQLDGAAVQGAQLMSAHLAHASLVGARLRGAHLEEATLWGVRLRGAELDGARFSGADLNDAQLDGAYLAGCALADADLAQLRWDGLRAAEELEATRAPLNERPEAYLAAADAYRRLRQACAAQGLYDRAGEIYRREMRMLQRVHGYNVVAGLARIPALLLLWTALVALTHVAVKPTARKARRLERWLHPLASAGAWLVRAWKALLASWHQLWKPAVRWIWYVALELLCGYGERVGRVVIAAGCVMLGMALIYLRLGQLTEPGGGTVTSFWHALYFSACSFSSLGYAAFSPNALGLTKWLGVVESFTGNFLLALFLVTFTRKLTR